MNAVIAACQQGDTWQEVVGILGLAWAAAFAWWAWLKHGNN